MKVFYLVAICSLSQLSQADEPFALLVKNHEVNPDIRIELEQLYHEFLGADFKSSGPISSRFETVYQHSTDFRVVAGTAHYSSPDGRPVSALVFLVSDKATFEKFLTSEQSGRRGVEFIGDGNRRTMTTQSYESKGVSYDFMDIHYLYQDGAVAVSGDKRIHGIDLKPVKRLLQQSVELDYRMLIRREHASSAIRERFLRRYSSRWGVLLQQFDNESTDEHLRRSAPVRTKKYLLEQLVGGLKTLDWKIQFPRRGKRPYSVEFRVEAEPGSELQETIRGFQIGRARVLDVDSDNTVARIGLHVRLPVELRGCLVEVFPAASRSSELHDLFVNAVSAGTLNVECALLEDVHELPAALATVGLSSSKSPIIPMTQTLPDRLANAAEDLQHMAMTALQTQLSCDLDLVGNLLTAKLSFKSDVASHARDTVALKDKRNPALAHFQLDAAAFLEDGSLSFLKPATEDAERWYAQTILRERPEAVFMNRTEITLPQGHSVIPRLTGEGDWKAEGAIYTTDNGNSIKANLQVGRELFGLYSAWRIRTDALQYIDLD